MIGGSRRRRDPQLEKAVELVMTDLKKKPLPKFERPAYPNYPCGSLPGPVRRLQQRALEGPDRRPARRSGAARHNIGKAFYVYELVACSRAPCWIHADRVDDRDRDHPD